MQKIWATHLIQRVRTIGPDVVTTGEDVMKNAHPTNADFIAHWRRVGPMLARIRKHELRTFNYKEKQAIIDDLLQIGVDFARPRTTSGLVDFQRILHKQKR